MAILYLPFQLPEGGFCGQVHFSLRALGALLESRPRFTGRTLSGYHNYGYRMPIIVVSAVPSDLPSLSHRLIRRLVPPGVKPPWKIRSSLRQACMTLVKEEQKGAREDTTPTTDKISRSTIHIIEISIYLCHCLHRTFHLVYLCRKCPPRSNSSLLS